MGIAILVPTRERPAQFAEMVEAVLATAQDRIWIYAGVDLDDRSYDAMTFARTSVFRGSRMQLGPWTNELLQHALTDGHEIIASFGDDHRPRTPGWDVRVQEAFDRVGSGLVYCADGLQDERLPTAPFWSADVLRELGWMFPPNQKHLYCDDFWLRFARDIGRCSYLPDVLVEHLHPSSGKAVEDAVNVANDAHHDADREAFESFVASDEYRTCVQRVRAVL